MARPQIVSTLLLFLALLSLSLALKFDLQAHTGHNARYERCIRNFVGRETLVLVTAIVSGSKGDGQVVHMRVSTQDKSTSGRGNVAIWQNMLTCVTC